MLFLFSSFLFTYLVSKFYLLAYVNARIFLQLINKYLTAENIKKIFDAWCKLVGNDTEEESRW